MRNSEVEMAVIGSLLRDNELLPYIDKITGDDITDPILSKILYCMKSLYSQDKPVDLVTLNEVLNWDTQMIQIAIDCTQSVISTASFQSYFQTLKSYTIRRRINKALQQISNMLTEKVDPTEIKLNAIQLFNEIRTGEEQQNESMEYVMMETLETIQHRHERKNDTSNYTGLIDFDRATGGLFGGEMTTLAARPGIGKTALALQIAKHYGKNGKVVEFLSKEMSQAQLGLRMIANEARVDGRKMRMGDLSEDDFRNIMQVINQLYKLPIFINTSVNTVNEIRNICRDRQQRNGLDLLVVDYMQLLDGKGESREREVANISRGLKRISLEFNIPVLALSQLNREGDTRRPILRDLRESGAIEQDSDNVIFLHRPDDNQLKGKDLAMKQECERNGTMYVECILAKMRQSETGMFAMQYIPKYLEFRCFYKGAKR